MESSNRELRAELAAVIRDNRELIAQRLEQCYVEQYPHSRANQMNASDIHQWTLFEISEIASAIEHDDLSGRTYESMPGDLLVDPHNPELTPFVNFLANIHFEARTIAPVLYAVTLRDSDYGSQLISEFESHIQKVLAENCRRYAERVSQPRAIARTWDFMSGMVPLGDYEDTPAKRYLTEEAKDEERSVATRISPPPFDALSPREQQVLDLLVEGKTNGEIASALDIRQNTVKNHIARIFDKYNVNSRAELISRVLGR